MLIIEWLYRLPGSDGIVIFRKTETNCASAAEAAAEADTLWSLAGTGNDRSADGFQVVDLGGRSVQLARYAVERSEPSEHRSLGSG